MDTETAIIGAGPAGLSVAAMLSERGQRALLLDAAPRVGDSWRAHYDRLHLHTPKQTSALPGLRFPKDYPTFPSRDEVASYLETYAQHFKLQPRLGQRVVRAEPDGKQWLLTLASGQQLTARSLVVASGNTRVPVVPTFDGQSRFAGQLSHTAGYKNSKPFLNQRVLVVGFGNSASEIALDLAEHDVQVALSVRGPVNVFSRDSLELMRFGPARWFKAWGSSTLPLLVQDAYMKLEARAQLGPLSDYGLKPLEYGPVTAMVKYGQVPMIDVGTLACIRSGQIGLYPGIREFTGSGVVFEDGRSLEVDAILLGTGYSPGLPDFLPQVEAQLDERGRPRAVVAAEAGGRAPSNLYFVGFRTAGLGALNTIAKDAVIVAEAIASSIK